jgi:hypothetical protein
MLVNKGQRLVSGPIRNRTSTVSLAGWLGLVSHSRGNSSSTRDTPPYMTPYGVGVHLSSVASLSVLPCASATLVFMSCKVSEV